MISRRLTLSVFGIAVVASGCLRYFGREGGEKGLWFGLVMGALALAGALLVAARPRLGLSLGLTSIAFVGGWFSYEALVKKGWAQAETRQLVILGLTILVTLALAAAGRRSAPGT